MVLEWLALDIYPEAVEIRLTRWFNVGTEAMNTEHLKALSNFIISRIILLSNLILLNRSLYQFEKIYNNPYTGIYFEHSFLL